MNIKNLFDSKTSKIGGYSITITAIVLAILIVLNLIIGLLPGTITHLDISSSKLYSVSSNTKVVVNSLEKDVVIYRICQAGEDDEIITRLIDKYKALSSHITVVEKNPDVYPTFAQQYTSGDIYNNDLIVECGDKYRYISYTDIYQVASSSYNYSSNYDVSFDGEGQITAAIKYVSSDEVPQIYLLTGHDEIALSDSLKNEIQKENYEINEISLLTTDELPLDAAFVMINGPQRDISEKEKEILKDYTQAGGKLLILAGPAADEEFTNLYALASEYNLTINDGIVIEEDRSSYALGMPYVLLPSIEDTDVTAPLLEETKYILTPIASGISRSDDSSYMKTTALLSTSDQSFSKAAGYKLSTYEFEEGDIYGPFVIAALVDDNSGSKNGKVIWISSSYLLDEDYVSMSAGANTDFALNCMSELSGAEESISIRSKSLNNEYLTISESQANLLKIITLAFIPLVFIAMGVVELISRRKA